MDTKNKYAERITKMYPYNYHYNYRQINESPAMKEKKRLRRDSNAISLAVMGFAGWSLVAGVMIGVISLLISEGFTLLDDTQMQSDMMLDTGVELFLYLINPVLIAAPPFLIMAKIMKIPASFYLPLNKPKGGVSFSLVVFGFGACMLAQLVAVIISVVMSWTGLKEPEFSLPAANGIPEKLIMLIGVSIFPGIIEELIFRGIILQWLRRYGDGFAILVSSIIFGFIHMNLAQIPFAMMVGIALGVIAVRTESLIIPMIVHAANNAFSLLMEWFWPEFMSGLTELEADICYLGIIFLIILIGLIAMLYIGIKRSGFWRLTPHRSVLPSKTCFGTFWSTPGAVIMTAVVVGVTVLTYLEPYLQEWLEMLAR